MKKFRRIISLALLLCMLSTMLPPMPESRAAEVIQRYELDTDGIDPGATYLIVNTATAGTGNALKFIYGSSNSTRDLRNQTLTVQTDENGNRYIATGFTSEADCLFQFSAKASGKITHGDYAVDLANSRYTSGTPSRTLTFTEVGGGAYRISYSTSSSWWGTTYYLRYNNSDWARSTTSSTVYLYKLTEYAVSYNVHFDGNGYTSGTLPQDAEDLDGGTQYTIPAAPVELRKDVGLDTWLFLCWNTKADGSGTEYLPGDVITISEDLTLYADWYQQTKYAVTMITDLDGVRTDVDVISGQNKTFYALLSGTDGPFIPLEKTADGTYTTKVVENGDYIIYSRVDDGEYEPVHGHKVTIYNQDGATECQHFTVTYDTQGGSWAEGEDPGRQMCHALDNLTLTDKTPTLEGNRFLGWKDQNGNTYAPGEMILSVQEKTTLSAIWEHTIDITVNVTIDHNGGDGYNNADNRFEALMQFLREENGVNMPLDQGMLDENHISFVNDPVNHITTYTLIVKNMPQGIYNATSEKHHYDVTVERIGAADEDQIINVLLKYVPESVDLTFEVEVNFDTEEEKTLLPIAVNVKVLYWGYNSEGVLGWHTSTKQEGDLPPTTLFIDPETGKASGYYTVFKEWAVEETDEPHAYVYRVEVTSIAMPDGRIIPVTGDKITYKADGAGIYVATVSIVGGGKVPTYPAETDTTLTGAYYDGTAQNGVPTVTIEITPFTVTFDAGEGTINGQPQLQLQNQFLYPDLNLYTAVNEDASKVFLGWFDENGNPVQNLNGTYLTGDVTYVAQYGDSITLSGNVEVSTTYEQDGHTVQLNEIDLPEEVMMLVRKQVGELFVTVDSQLVPITYKEGALYGTGSYRFENLPNDGTNYQIHVLTVNFDALYDNDLDGNFDQNEEIVIVDQLTATAKANVRLDNNPECYRLGIRLDTTQIAEAFRPESALVEILYRDLGDVHAYQVISEHTVPPYGVRIPLDQLGQGIGAEDAWIRHVDGTYYEHQLELSKLYGTVEGAYMPDGTEYTGSSPYTVVYGPPTSYLKQTADGAGAVEATLVPKEYAVILDLNLGDDTETPVRGMDSYMVDDGSGDARYAYVHTWSYGSSFEAFPYRDGYVFKGWLENAENNADNDLVVEGGKVYVGATLAKNVTLTAQWEELSGTDYTIRYLELNTNKVLHGAQAVSGAVEGSKVVAADAVIAIDGYEYAGALVDGSYVHKSNNPAMTVTANPEENLMVIYYLPDSSSGYTEQVESNLSANKYAVLENNGTYTITLDTYTKDNPITTKISYDTPLDVVLVLDQSGSMHTNGALDTLKDSVSNFVTLLANHGRENEVDHRIAIVGYASDEYGGYTNPNYPTAGKDGSKWYNTGVFDTHGDFHAYSITGFNYTEFTGSVSPDETYYTYANGEYLLLTYHEEYRHLITEAEARQALLDGKVIYGYVDGQFVELTRNSSGLWLYGDKKLYSAKKFFTYHTDVWTHREGLERRQIHAYGVGDAYHEVDAHFGIFTRTETRDADPEKSIYRDALVPVSLGANGSGGVTPGLLAAAQKLGGNGKTHVSYGMEMANSVFAANPLAEGEERTRIVIVFTDGKPGDGSNFDEEDANKALAHSYVAIHTYNARVYTIGLFGSHLVDAESDQVFFMHGLSSNYPNAQTMDDVWSGVSYHPAASGYRLNMGGPYYVEADGEYYLLSLSNKYANRVYYNCWGYTDANGTDVVISETPVAEGHPIITEGMIAGHTIYRQYGVGYQETPYSGYYTEAESEEELRQYFANTVQGITTNITQEIVLENDTIMRDIMNQGLVLTDGTVITVYTQEGNYDLDTGDVVWTVDESGNPVLTELVSLELGSGNTSAVDETSGVAIHTYNLNASNPTNPNKSDYHPHTVDITGYNFSEWYISQDHTKGYKMVVTITRIEAKDDVQWSRSVATNESQSGLWLPADENGNRQLLLPFNQPTTIFVERAYVLDYGKEFVLSDWYFDDDGDKDATPIHLDLDIADGINWFDPENPNTANAVDGAYGNTKYGNVRIEDGKVIYSPTTMNWGSYDEFYVFGNTWRKTVLAQDANTNGNLWNKVVVIPANNIYYEDSFITTEGTTQNGIEGFTFTGAWSVEGQDSGNEEVPEHLESAPYGDVHGWTDSLGDDLTFTDGSAHVTGLNGEMGASAEFTFTGTGVEVYTRTNARSGMVVAVLSSVTTNGDGAQTTTLYKSLAMDNQAASGDYYHIPTVSFMHLPYGTYSLKLIATAADGEDGSMRYQYYIDGVRILNPLGNTTNYLPDDIKGAYELETNSVFTSVREVLLDYGDFNVDMPDSTDGKLGAVFIDQDQSGVGVPTYDIGVFETFGPKNEVYLSAGQAIVLKVEEGNNYFVGLKSLTGATVTANVSGIDQTKEPTAITITHTTDMYYRVNPMDGYIVIQNGNTDGALLSITNLRTTNMTAPVSDGGILPVAEQEAVMMMGRFYGRMMEITYETQYDPGEKPEEPTQDVPKDPQLQVEATLAFANTLFTSVRKWLEES